MDKNWFVALAAAAGVYLCAGVKRADAWFSVTHTDLVKKSLALLEQEKKVKQVAFYKKWHEQILEGCVAPDKNGDIDEGPGKHYYSCVNPKGKELAETDGYFRNRLGEYAPSARTLFMANYTGALSLYKSGNTERAMVMLGRAVHFIGDMCCTPHVSNIPSTKNSDRSGNVHFTFEEHANGVCTEHKADSFDKRLMKYYEKDDLSEALNRLIKFAAKYVETITSFDRRAFDDTCKDTMPFAQQNIMAVLLRFCDDCSADKGNYLKDGKSYTFINEGSGLILTADPKNITLAEQSKEAEQKLKVVLNDMGLFGIGIADGGFVNGKLKGYGYPVKGAGQPSGFRAEALGNKRFRISTEESSFKKYLCCQKNGKLSTDDLVPNDKSMIWILK